MTAAVPGGGRHRPELSTAGGTSDGRFIAPTGAEVIELGRSTPPSTRVDERVACEDLERLSRMYEGILERLLGPEDAEPEGHARPGQPADPPSGPRLADEALHGLREKA